jgi:branched-chain amino acid transport system permease protein
MTRIALSPWQILALEVAFWIAFAACYLVFPDRLNFLTQILILGLFAVSLDLATGYAGILTLGHAIYFGVGAYGAGILAKTGWGDPLTLLLVALVLGAALAYLLSFLIIRAFELTQLMVSIAILAICAELANRASSVTGGSDGLQGVSIWPVFGVFPFDLWGRTAFIYTFIIVLCLFLVVRRVLRSPYGLTLKGVHGNIGRMEALGSPVNARLRFAYVLSAALASVAGALLTQTTAFVGLDVLSVDRSAVVLIVLVLGGTGCLYGGLVGAIIYMLLHDFFADLSPEYWMFWMGLFLMAVVITGGGGILGGLSKLVKVDDE